MKTKTANAGNTGKSFLTALILLISIGLFNAAQACTANFTYTLGVNGEVSFTNTSSGFGVGVAYFWNPGDGGSMWGTNPTHTYIANGTYNVRLIASDTNCTDTVIIPVTITNVTQPCTLSANFTFSYGSQGLVNFTSTSTGTYPNTFYYWNPGDGSGRVLGTSTYTHTYTYSGSYTVWLTLADTGAGYCTDSIEMNVSVTNADSNNQNCNLVANYTYTVGLNGNVNFTSTSTGVNYSDFVWNPGDGSGTTTYPYYENTYHHSYTANGTFYAKLNITPIDSGYCRDSITYPITITNVDTTQPCTLSANFTISYGADGQATLTSTSTGTYPNTLYYWNPGDSSATQQGSSVITYTYPFLGTYNATLIIKDTGSAYCIDSISLPVNITNRDSLQASFIYYSDTITAGQYDFISTSRGTDANTYYKWTPGDTSAADSGLDMTTYSHVYANNGPYSATLTIWYTIPPHVIGNNRLESIHYDESSYTAVINVTTAPSGIVHITNTGGNFALYPNPNNGKFRLSVTHLGNANDGALEITNLLGKVVLNTPIVISNQTFTRTLDIRNTPAGIYFIKVVTTGKTYTSKLVIQK